MNKEANVHLARQISTALLRPGMQLGRALYDDQGRVLLQRGVIIKESYIPKIRKSFSSITIDDDETEGIEIPETISLEARLRMQEELAQEWTRLRAEVSFERVAFRPQFAKSMREQIRSLLSVVQNTSIIQEDLAALASYDNATYVHSVNVSIYSLVIGTVLGLPESMLVDLGVGALLHDLGKLWVPEAVLNKAGSLTVEEYDLMKTHTQIGHDILVKQPELSFLVAHCAYQHHERCNGTGYPRGLHGDQIHLFGKILAVSDVYDAMVMDRPYRSGMAPGQVLEFLFSRAGTEFDLDIVSIFSRKVSMYPIGSKVLLSNGCEGIVARTHAIAPSRPVVRVTQDGQGRPVRGKEIDLTHTLNVTIIESQPQSLLEVID